jgi:hypothetical protein
MYRFSCSWIQASRCVAQTVCVYKALVPLRRLTCSLCSAGLGRCVLLLWHRQRLILVSESVIAGALGRAHTHADTHADTRAHTHTHTHTHTYTHTHTSTMNCIYIAQRYPRSCTLGIHERNLKQCLQMAQPADDQPSCHLSLLCHTIHALTGIATCVHTQLTLLTTAQH